MHSAFRHKKKYQAPEKRQDTNLVQALQNAFHLYQGGRLSEAETLLLALLRSAACNGDILHLLGLIAYRTGRPDEAVTRLRDSARILGQSPHVMNSLGVVLQEVGNNEEAIDVLKRATFLNPDFPEAYNNLGNALRKAGRFDEAVQAYRQSLQISPMDAEVMNNLAMALIDQGRVDEAIATYKAAVAANPRHAPSYRNLGNAFREKGNNEEALGAYAKALELKPDFVEAHNDLGNLLKNSGRVDEAVREYETAIRLRPGYPEAYCNLGNILRERGLTTEAVECYRSALRTRPDFAEVISNLGNAFKDQGNLTDAMGAYKEALRLKLSLADTHSNLIYARQFIPGATLKAVLEDHLEWNRVHAIPLREKRLIRPSGYRRLSDPLTLGFLSGDFRRHPVGYFIIRVLEALSGMKCTVICYVTQTEHDDMTERFRKAAHVWKSCHHLSDEALAQSIHEDGVDVLFDLNGHIEWGRLLVFARRPAPLQITWAGYMATTGLETMDYIIADRHEIPEGSEQYYTEKVIRMPGSFVCYDPPAYAPPVLPLPAFSNGYVTFGCFNLLTKISPEVVNLWSVILRRIPGSRLMLKTKELNGEKAKERIGDLFSRHGVGPDRIDLVGGTSHREHLDHYNRVDIALDPFPFSGSTTTLESLWMGVPVITMPGETFASRHSLSFLSTTGLTNTIADTPDHYVTLAENLAGNLPYLSEVRLSLRDRFRASPLCDGEAFAEKLLAALEELRVGQPSIGHEGDRPPSPVRTDIVPDGTGG